MRLFWLEESSEAQMQRVEIRVKGQLDEQWSDWFEGLTITHTAENDTLLVGPVADQAALYGLLAKLEALGVPLLSVQQVEDTE
jgi:hypothetical protein